MIAGWRKVKLVEDFFLRKSLLSLFENFCDKLAVLGEKLKFYKAGCMTPSINNTDTDLFRIPRDSLVDRAGARLR